MVKALGRRYHLLTSSTFKVVIREGNINMAYQGTSNMAWARCLNNGEGGEAIKQEIKQKVRIKGRLRKIKKS